MKQRIPEPELMETEAQARAYANADFSQAHESYVALFARWFPDCPARATALDLGCGPGDVTRRLARAHPGFRFHGVDGSSAMLRHGRQALRREAELANRIRFFNGYIPGVRLPRRKYDVILSSSFLHHLHDPQALWKTVRQHARDETVVFVVDLLRPTSRAAARALVKRYTANEPPVLQRDFYNSLLAAFTPAEVRSQLRTAGLHSLKVKVISDRHLAVFGRVRCNE